MPATWLNQRLMAVYTVAQGDCVSNIAKQFGLLPDTIWDHPQNAQLKQLRKDPNVLFPGDALFIPDKTLGIYPRPTDKRHLFKKKGVATKLKIRLMDGDQPRANVAYKLEVDGNWTTGTTDGDGYINEPIPPNAQKGQLLVGDGPTQDKHQLKFGTVDPMDTDSGAQGRLLDLGFGTDHLPDAINAFQTRTKIPVTGQLDDVTRAKLKEMFGQ